jgi:hypothetical protein
MKQHSVYQSRYLFLISSKVTFERTPTSVDTTQRNCSHCVVSASDSISSQYKVIYKSYSDPSEIYSSERSRYILTFKKDFPPIRLDVPSINRTLLPSNRTSLPSGRKFFPSNRTFLQSSRTFGLLCYQVESSSH